MFVSDYHFMIALLTIDHAASLLVTINQRMAIISEFALLICRNACVFYGGAIDFCACEAIKCVLIHFLNSRASISVKNYAKITKVLLDRW
jgi:hypothetical protein